MIGLLSGSIRTKIPGQIILLVSGVGYLVTVPPNLLQKVKVADSIEIFVYTHHKEDTLDLYGFSTQEELSLFKLVMTVSGIGPKTALLVIDQGVDLVERAVKNADVDFFTAIPRLGRKNAQKIIIELKNKLGGLKELELASESEEDMQAIDALRSMGYTKQEATKAIRSVPSSVIRLEDRISFALKQMGKNHG